MAAIALINPPVARIGCVADCSREGCGRFASRAVGYLTGLCAFDDLVAAGVVVGSTLEGTAAGKRLPIKSDMVYSRKGQAFFPGHRYLYNDLPALHEVTFACILFASDNILKYLGSINKLWSLDMVN